MFDWIVDVISKGGHLGIALLMFLENVFPPIPSELVMPMGGYLADLGRLHFWPVVLAGTLGSTLGQVLLYYAGSKLGEERLKRWADEYGHWLAMSHEDIDRAKDWFARKRGSMAVFLGRLVPGIRSIISIPAGVVKMSMVQFLPFTVLGTFAWTAALTYAGALVGQNIDKIQAFLNPLAYFTLAVCVGGYLFRVVKGYRRKQARTRAGAQRSRDRVFSDSSAALRARSRAI